MTGRAQAPEIECFEGAFWEIKSAVEEGIAVIDAAACVPDFPPPGGVGRAQAQKLLVGDWGEGGEGEGAGCGGEGGEREGGVEVGEGAGEEAG